MQQLDIIVTDELAGGADPFEHSQISVRFHRWTGSERMPLMDGQVWAFVDWNSTAIDPQEACRRLRCEPMTAASTVVVVIGAESPDTRRRSIRAGADDCHVGEFSRRTLLDYVLKRVEPGSSSSTQGTIALGRLLINVAGYQVKWDGTPVPMMPNEFRLLRFLAQHSNRLFTRAQLIEALGKQEPPIDERTVDAWAVRLRRAFRNVGAPEMLRTVRSIGYIFEIPE